MLFTGKRNSLRRDARGPDASGVGRRLRFARGATAAVVALAITAVAASTSSASSGRPKPAKLVVGVDASASQGPIILIGGPLSDAFHATVKIGADAAAKAFGVHYQYSAPANLSNVVPDYTQLFNEAIARHPSALVVGDFVPSSFDPLIKKAVAAGIPVFVFNTGLNQWQSDGALGFVGEIPYNAGAAAGAELAKAGVHQALCVNSLPVNPYIDQRCQGAASALKKDGGSVVTLHVPTADALNPQALTQDIEGSLRSHPHIDGIYSAADGYIQTMQKAISAVGKTGKVKICTADIWGGELQDIKHGSVLCAINQQPYLQGWDGIQMAVQYLRYGFRPTGPINVGGLVVTKANVAKAITVSNRYPGILGTG